MSQDAIRNAFLMYGSDWNILFNMSTFNNLFSIGLDLISSDAIRRDISTLYNYHYPYILDCQHQTDKFFIEQLQPTYNEVIGTWYRNTDKSAKELEDIRTHGKLQSIMKSMRYYTNNRLILLVKVKPRIEQLISDIEHESQRF